MTEHTMDLRLLDNDTLSVVCTCMGQRVRGTLGHFPIDTPMEELLQVHAMHVTTPMAKVGPRKPSKEQVRSEERNTILAGYRKWLYFMANQMARVQSEVDDLAQEGYIAMWRAFESFDPDKGSLPSWLTKTARLRMQEVAVRGTSFGKEASRGVHTTARSVGATQGSLNDLLDEGFDFAEASDLLQQVIESYMKGQVHKALDSLTDHQRRYVLLRFWYGFTETQMYSRQMFPPGTVVRNLWEGKTGAKNRLRAVLDPSLIAA